MTSSFTVTPEAIVPATVAAAAAGDPALRRWAEKAGRRAAATEEHAGSCGLADGGRGGHVGTPRPGPRPRPDPRAPRGLGRRAPRGPEPGPDGTAPAPAHRGRRPGRRSAPRRAFPHPLAAPLPGVAPVRKAVPRGRLLFIRGFHRKKLGSNFFSLFGKPPRKTWSQLFKSSSSN